MHDKIRVTLLTRKRRKNLNFSIEFLFNEVSQKSNSNFEIQIKKSPLLSNGIIKRVFNLLATLQLKSDIFHITGDVHYLSFFLPRKKLINTYHDLGFLYENKGIKHFLLKYLWLKIPIRFSRIITVNSISTYNEIIKYVKYSKDKIRIINAFISSDFKYYQKKFDKDNPIILQVGTKKNKNLARVIESLKGIRCRLFIIGDINKEIENILIASKINYVLFVDLTIEEIIQLYRQSDILSLCSIYEGFGMPILEAQATGRVVLTSNCFSMPEVGGDGAHYVNPLDVSDIRNGFLKLIADDNYRENLVIRGFENVKRFESEVIVAKYYDLYTEIRGIKA